MRGRGLFGAIVSAAVSGTTVAQESAQGLPCPGTWTLSAGQTQTIMGPGAAGGEGPVRMNVLQCGEELVLRDFLTGIPDGQRDRSFREAGGAYVHETSADGVPVAVHLEPDGVRRMSGRIVIQGGMFVKPLELVHEGGGQSMDIGCGEEGETEPELEADIPAEAAVEATVAAMRAQGMAPPPGSGFELGDYVRTYVSPGTGARDPERHGVRRMMLRLDADWRILPQPEAIAPGRLECAVEKHSLEPTRYFLIIKPNLRPDGRYEAIVQVIDVSTSIVEATRMVIGDDSRGTLADAIDGAWRKVERPGRPLTDGRAAG